MTIGLGFLGSHLINAPRHGRDDVESCRRRFFAERIGEALLGASGVTAGLETIWLFCLVSSTGTDSGPFGDDEVEMTGDKEGDLPFEGDLRGEGDLAFRFRFSRETPGE
jgi:hypothetical protein